MLYEVITLGYLFRYNSTSTSKQNLMVFIHPIILRDQAAYSDLSTEKYNLYRNHAQAQINQRDPLALPTEPVNLQEQHRDVLISPEIEKSRSQTTVNE